MNKTTVGVLVLIVLVLCVGLCIRATNDRINRLTDTVDSLAWENLKLVCLQKDGEYRRAGRHHLVALCQIGEDVYHVYDGQWETIVYPKKLN